MGTTFVDIAGEAYDELQWQCFGGDRLWQITIACDSDILLPILRRDSGAADTRVSGKYFYHTDHLGSANWVTKDDEAVQFIHYMPYGEMWYNQRGSAYNERYKYTGKERDEETGNDYFGARYYAAYTPMWLSPDPLMDKYPGISPYAYCNWNPLKYVDPDGLSTHTDEDGNVVAVYDDNDLNIYKHSNSKISSWGDVYENPLTIDNAEVMGQSLHAMSFADQNLYNSTRRVRHDQKMKIKYGSSMLGDEIFSIINSKPSLIKYALNARSGGKWDLKTAHPNEGSLLSGNIYLSSRDAGNFIAGAIKGQAGLLSPIVQFGYGAYNISGNSVYKTGLITLGTGILLYASPLLGTATAIYIMNGEDYLTQTSINAGFNYVK